MALPAHIHHQGRSVLNSRVGQELKMLKNLSVDGSCVHDVFTYNEIKAVCFSGKLKKNESLTQ